MLLVRQSIRPRDGDVCQIGDGVLSGEVLW